MKGMMIYTAKSETCCRDKTEIYDCIYEPHKLFMKLFIQTVLSWSLAVGILVVSTGLEVKKEQDNAPRKIIKVRKKSHCNHS